jgi:hypothetical protein
LASCAGPRKLALGMRLGLFLLFCGELRKNVPGGLSAKYIGRRVGVWFARGGAEVDRSDWSRTGDDVSGTPF